MTKERTILFSGPMVRAILDGRKTQTRRVVKDEAMPTVYHGDKIAVPQWYFRSCPYGVPGDRLWVRETWQSLHNNGQRVHEFEDWQRSQSEVFYRADESDPDSMPMSGRWRPSIFMPRWASRITLEITGVRVERLQDISEVDAQNEGMRFHESSRTWGEGITHGSALNAFAWLWHEINGKRPGCAWNDNPWVWVVEFKRSEHA